MACQKVAPSGGFQWSDCGAYLPEKAKWNRFGPDEEVCTELVERRIA